MNKRILVVSYSRSGTTSRVASILAQWLGADVDTITEPRPRAGFGGYTRSALEALASGLPTIHTEHNPKDYDLVVVGTPVWVGTIASPVRSYLTAHQGQFRKVGFFAVMGGRGAEDALREMRYLTGAMQAPTCAFTQGEVEREKHRPKCERFVEQLEASLELPGPQRGEIPGVPIDFHLRPAET